MSCCVTCGGLSVRTTGVGGVRRGRPLTGQPRRAKPSMADEGVCNIAWALNADVKTFGAGLAWDRLRAANWQIVVPADPLAAV